MANVLVNENSLSAVADAIRAKNGTQDTYKPAEFPAAILALPEPKPVFELNDVNFYDYDGTIVAAYTAAEFAALEAMPANPEHEGLIAQGWNWTLADAKTFVQTYGALDIGQMYVTNDGALRLYVTLPEDHLTPTVKVYDHPVTVYWGDGSETSIDPQGTAGSATHTYARAGKYVVSIMPTSPYGVGANGPIFTGEGNEAQFYPTFVEKVEEGNMSNTQVNIYTGMNAMKTIARNVGNVNNGFLACWNLRHLNIKGNIGGDNGINQAKSLQSISCSGNFIAAGPFPALSRLTAHGNAKSSMLKESAILMAAGLGPQSSLYNASFALRRVRIAEGSTTISASMFQYCYSLSDVVIPDTVKTIMGNSFSYCYALGKITIPAIVTSIAASAFSSCTSMKEIHFRGTTPPTVANSNAWSNLPTTCKIYVPAGYLAAYTGATNYPSSSTYTYIEE